MEEVQHIADTAVLKERLLGALEVCEDQAKALVEQGVEESDDTVYLRDQVVTAIERLLQLIDGLDPKTK